MFEGGEEKKEGNFMEKKLIGDMTMKHLCAIGAAIILIIIIYKLSTGTDTETFMSGAKLARVQPNNRSAFYAARSDGYGEPSEDYARSVEGFRVKDAWKSGREGLLGRRHAGPWIARKKFQERK